ncbi:MAG: ATP-binding cassette domain-containing protein [Proteobacteria bacterium]|jgi:phospholipid/cholesterol/gamma-HCH transport system ATP-binding protein|nr:ATP-binding cassette domain-containing protein [Pseudomonadota bacterium]
MAVQPIIQIRGLVNRFGTQVVHDGLDLDMNPGEILGVVGGSGSGKSVLLHTILGLRQATAGSVRIHGKDITSMDRAQMLDIQQRWGVLFQSGALFSSLSVLDNIQLSMKEYTRMAAATREGLANLKLQMVGLPLSAGKKFPAELSGGMVKRAALARALALDPPLLFLDEPTSGLDPISASEFDELIAYLRDNLGFSVFMITHDLDSLFNICDRIAVLVDKRMVVGTLDEILANTHPWIQRYFHGARSRAALGVKE